VTYDDFRKTGTLYLVFKEHRMANRDSTIETFPVRGFWPVGLNFLPVRSVGNPSRTSKARKGGKRFFFRLLPSVKRADANDLDSVLWSVHTGNIRAQLARQLDGRRSHESVDSPRSAARCRRRPGPSRDRSLR